MSETAKSLEIGSDHDRTGHDGLQAAEATSHSLQKWGRLFASMALTSLSACSPHPDYDKSSADSPPALVESAPARIQFFNAALTPDENNQLIASLYFLSSQSRTNWPTKFLFELRTYDNNGNPLESLSIEVPVDRDGGHRQSINTGAILPGNTSSFEGVLTAVGDKPDQTLSKTISRVPTNNPQGN